MGGPSTQMCRRTAEDQRAGQELGGEPEAHTLPCLQPSLRCPRCLLKPRSSRAHLEQSTGSRVLRHGVPLRPHTASFKFECLDPPGRGHTRASMGTCLFCLCHSPEGTCQTPRPWVWVGRGAAPWEPGFWLVARAVAEAETGQGVTKHGAPSELAQERTCGSQRGHGNPGRTASLTQAHLRPRKPRLLPGSAEGSETGNTGPTCAREAMPSRPRTPSDSQWQCRLLDGAWGDLR